MFRTRFILVAVVALVLGGAACTRPATNTNTVPNANSNEVTNTSDTTNSSVINSNTAPTNTSQSSTNTNASRPARLVEYSTAALAEAHQNGKAVLWFHAAWCPICQAIERDLNSGGLSTLPSGVTLLKVNFDTASDLRQQYGVVYQYTFVQVDAQGNKQKLWSATSVEAVRDGIL